MLIPADGAPIRRSPGHHHPGRRRGRLIALRPRGPPQALLQLLRHPVLHDNGRHTPPCPGSTKSAWNSPMTAPGWQKAATSPSTTIASPVGKGRVEQTEPRAYSADEACDVGADSGLPALPVYGPYRQQIHQRNRVGTTRHRQRPPRPPHHTRGLAQHRNDTRMRGASPG